eukprot:1149313-Pelagomonas_calceolata.AAC.4
MVRDLCSREICAAIELQKQKRDAGSGRITLKASFSRCSTCSPGMFESCKRMASTERPHIAAHCLHPENV